MISFLCYHQVKLSVENVKNGKAEVLDADVCLVAIGRRPYTQGLGLEALGIPVDRIGRVEVRARHSWGCLFYKRGGGELIVSILSLSTIQNPLPNCLLYAP